MERRKHIVNLSQRRKEELSFKKKPFLCKMGIHEYGELFDGLMYYVGCKKCYARHDLFK